jgi:hypothetical protein
VLHVERACLGNVRERVIFFSLKNGFNELENFDGSRSQNCVRENLIFDFDWMIFHIPFKFIGVCKNLSKLSSVMMMCKK